MGINHLYKLTKTLIKSCPDINNNRKLINHSARRHLVQKLQDKGVQNAQIMHISGHKNVASINSYSRLNQNQQKNISKVLADTEGKILYDNGKSDRQVDVGSSMGQLCSSHDSHITMPCPPAIGTQPYSTANQTSTNTMSADTRLSSFFQGNTYIYGGTFNFNTPQTEVSSTSHGNYKHKTVCEKDYVNDAILKPKYKIILPLTSSDSDSE